jgi:hypothetical protein
LIDGAVDCVDCVDCVVFVVFVDCVDCADCVDCVEDTNIDVGFCNTQLVKVNDMGKVLLNTITDDAKVHCPCRLCEGNKTGDAIEGTEK